MKSSRFKHDYSASASKLHKQVGEILRDSLFKNYHIYQEYPVNKINPAYPSGREKFDWYIKDLNLVIEVHGQQHYGPVCFGGVSEQEAEANFKRQKFRDAMKRDAAIAAGSTYIIIKYDEKINAETIFKKITEANDTLEESIEFDPQPEEMVKEFEGKVVASKDRRQERMELKKAASERRKEIRKYFKSSEKYKNQLEKAKKFRKQMYLKSKELKQESLKKVS